MKECKDAKGDAEVGGGATHCKNRYWCGGIAAFSSVGVFAQPEAEFINVQFLLVFLGIILGQT